MNNPIFSHHALVRIYDAASGRLLWEKQVAAPKVVLPFPLVSIDNHFLYLIEPSGNGERVSIHEPLWTLMTGARALVPHYFRVAAAGKVVAYSIRTGRRKWTYELPHVNPVIGSAGVFSAGSTVFVAVFFNGHSHLVALERATGALRWTFSFCHVDRNACHNDPLGAAQGLTQKKRSPRHSAR